MSGPLDDAVREANAAFSRRGELSCQLVDEMKAAANEATRKQIASNDHFNPKMDAARSEAGRALIAVRDEIGPEAFELWCIASIKAPVEEIRLCLDMADVKRPARTDRRRRRIAPRGG